MMIDLLARPPLVPPDPVPLDPLLEPDSLEILSLTLTVLSLHAGDEGVVGQQGVGGVQVVLLHDGVVVLVCGEVLSHLDRSTPQLTRPVTDSRAQLNQICKAATASRLKVSVSQSESSTVAATKATNHC